MTVQSPLSQRRYRNQHLWWAFLLHRLSGLGLALFLPFHFYVLGTALEDAAALNAVLDWGESGIVKAAEAGLVLLLSVHLAGGLRLLALELLAWRTGHKTLAALAVGFAMFVALTFFMIGG